MAQLKAVTVQFMVASLGPRTWLDTFRIGRKLDEKSLILACLSSFDEVVHTLCFLQLSYEDFLAVVEFQSQCMEIPSLFEVVMSWIKSRETERKQHLEALFRYIDFEGMDVTFLQQNVLNESVIQESHDVVLMFNQILMEHVLNNKKFKEQPLPGVDKRKNSSVSSLSSSLTSPRNSLTFPITSGASFSTLFPGLTLGDGDEILIVGGFGISAERSAEKYNPKSKRSSKCKSAPKPCIGSCAALIGKKVYVAGGYDGRKYLSHVQVYDTEGNSWKVVKGVMATGRSDAAAATAYGMLYVIGGCNNKAGECKCTYYLRMSFE